MWRLGPIIYLFQYLQHDWAREFPYYKKCSAINLSFDLLISNSIARMIDLCKLYSLLYTKLILLINVWALINHSGLYSNEIFILYSVMQSDGNRFIREVVSDNFNKTSRDEGNILGQIYEIKYACIIIMIILILCNIIRKCIHYIQ